MNARLKEDSIELLDGPNEFELYASFASHENPECLNDEVGPLYLWR